MKSICDCPTATCDPFRPNEPREPNAYLWDKIGRSTCLVERLNGTYRYELLDA